MKRIDIPIIERNCSIKEGINVDKIIEKYKNNIPFTREELIYLYDFYDELSIDTLEKIKDIKLNLVDDLAIIFECEKEEITNNAEELLKEPDRYVVFGGNLYLWPRDYICFPRLKYIGGNLGYFSIRECHTFNNLEFVGGTVDFRVTETITSLNNLKCIGEKTNFFHLEDASCLYNLKKILGDAYFDSLENVKGLENLRYIDGALTLKDLKDATGLENLEHVSSYIYAPNLQEQEIKKLKKVIRRKIVTKI